MERQATIQELLGNTDIYLIDQILKGLYKQKDKILDAGCGVGRNMQWFLINEMEIYGIDAKPEIIAELNKKYLQLPYDRIQVALVEELPFEEGYFQHVISSAVLHFANNRAHFKKMFSEMLRVLQSGGTLFIRTASDIGIEEVVEELDAGVFRIPDGSNRFLLTRNLLNELKKEFRFELMEPLKSVNVNDIRSMSTLLLRKI